MEIKEFELNPKTLPRHLHIALTAVITVHTGNSTGYIS
jgi:hypothetical protein